MKACEWLPSGATSLRVARLLSVARNATLSVDQPMLSIVVPAFNEEGRLLEEAARLERAVVRGAVDPSSTELIVVDDGSSDNTAQCAEDLFALTFTDLHVLRRQVNSGKGAAIRDGIAAAHASVVAFMDADMAVDPEQIPLLVAAIDDVDMAIGSRSIPGSSVECDSFRRALMGKTFNRLVNTLTGLGVGDTQCGFKAFRTPVARLLFHCMVVEGFAFDVDLLDLARRLGVSVAEVPVHWRDVDGSAVRPVVDPLSMAFDVFRLRVGRKLPPIPAVSVSIGPHDLRASLRSVLFDEFGRTLPVLDVPQDRVVVLFPLSAPEAVHQAVSRIGELIPDSIARNHFVSISELMDHGPLPALMSDGVASSAPSEIAAAERHHNEEEEIPHR